MTIGLLLAGGTSSRFIYGDKALYADFAERTYATLTNLCEEIYISCNSSNIDELQGRLPKAKFLLDQEPYVNQGPLSAFYALPFKHCDVLTLSVDNPELTAASLGQLLDFENAYAENYFTLSHLTFEKSSLIEHLENGNRRLKPFLKNLNAVAIAFSEKELIDHNEK